ncbi:MAG: Na+/H+ antiporter subunit D [Paracoccus sp. (in: a-proteobacteria)]|nr:Na+/H+ antiporter subunit D [Paracoccus sp. (in: a-proteobacteria)]
MSWLLTAPIAIPFVTGVLAFALRHYRAGAYVSIAGCAALLVASILLMSETIAQGVVAAPMGGWVAPFGIIIVADILSAIMVVITAIIALAVAVYALGDIDATMEAQGYHTMYNILIAGVVGSFLTGDLFNLYVWFEVMLISSFGLMVLGGRAEQIDGGVKYVALNLVSTILFLGGTGLLYGATGTLNMADLSTAVADVDDGLLTLIAMLFMISFGVKAALFPLFFWLPASYHTPSFAVSAVFAGLLTKVGVYALIRVFTLIFTHDPGFTHTLLLWIAGLTMLTGVLGAAAQSDFRKILSFHIVSQIGYMIMGLALFTPLGLVGSVFYLVHHIIVKANLFLVAGVAGRIAGDSELSRIGGLYKSTPLLAVLFVIPAFSLAGFPPLSGFWAKFVLVKASLEIQSWMIAFVALLVGLLTIYSMTKIWGQAFWEPHPDGREPTLKSLPIAQRRALIWPIAALAVMTIIIGLFPGGFIALAERGAHQLLQPAEYINAVMEARP